MNCTQWGNWFHNDDERGREVHRENGFFAGGQLQKVETDFLPDLFELFFRKVDAGSPEDLAEPFPERQ